MNDLPPDIATKLAGAAGAVVSMQLLKGTLANRITMGLCGTLISFYTADYVSHKTGLPEGLVGFLVGLFGMAIISKGWELVQGFPLTKLAVEYVRKIFGLPPKIESPIESESKG